MNPSILLWICVVIWGCTAFLQKLAADKMSPVFMQFVIAGVFACYVPIAYTFGRNLPNFKWNAVSAALTFVAAAMSIVGNILMYSALSNNKHSGSSAMIVSLYPSVTLILSAIFLHEQFSIKQIAGVIAMIVGACLLSF